MLRIKENSVLKVAYAVLMVLILSMGTLLGPLSGVARANDDEDYSFYKAASTLSIFYGRGYANPAEDYSDYLRGNVLNNAGNAGALMGYADSDRSGVNNRGFAASAISGAANVYGVDALQGDNRPDGPAQYAEFGYALRELGLDQMNDGVMSGIVRVVSGGLMLGVYHIANFVNSIMSVLLDVLQWVNPFKFFYGPISEYYNYNSYQEPDNIIESIANFIGGMYQLLLDFSWIVVIPLLLGILLFSILVKNSSQNSGKIRKFFIRVGFIAFGIPILGGIYTGVLEMLDKDVEAGSANLNGVISSTYFDFDRWVKNRAMDLPASGGVHIEVIDGSVSEASKANISTTTRILNEYSDGGSISSRFSKFVASLPNELVGANSDIIAAAKEEESNSVTDLLTRYINSDIVSSADYEQLTKKYMYVDEASKDKAHGFIDDIYDIDKFKGNDNNPNNYLINTGGVYKGSTNRFYGTGGPGANVCDVSSQVTLGSKCGLAPLAVYNYLNTTFDNNSFTVYSSDKSVSILSRDSHYAVTQSGPKILKPVNYVTAFATMLALAVIALGYALAIMIGSIKRTIQFIAAVPFATVGALSGIAKVIGYALMLLVEVLGTLFLYVLVVNFMDAARFLIEAPFKALAEGNEAASVAFVLVGGIFEIIFIVMFMFMALKLRSGFVKGVNDALADAVNRFIGGNDSNFDGANAKAPLIGAGAGGALGGVAAGAAMSAGKALAGNNSEGGEGEDNNSVVNGGDMLAGDSDIDANSDSDETNESSQESAVSGGDEHDDGDEVDIGGAVTSDRDDMDKTLAANGQLSREASGDSDEARAAGASGVAGAAAAMQSLTADGTATSDGVSNSGAEMEVAGEQIGDRDQVSEREETQSRAKMEGADGQTEGVDGEAEGVDGRDKMQGVDGDLAGAADAVAGAAMVGKSANDGKSKMQGANGQTGVDDQAKVQGADGQTKMQGVDDQSKAQGADGQTKMQGVDDQSKAQGADGQAKMQGTDGQAKAQGTDGQAKMRGTDGQAKMQGVIPNERAGKTQEIGYGTDQSERAGEADNTAASGQTQSGKQAQMGGSGQGAGEQQQNTAQGGGQQRNAPQGAGKQQQNTQSTAQGAGKQQQNTQSTAQGGGQQRNAPQGVGSANGGRSSSEILSDLNKGSYGKNAHGDKYNKGGIALAGRAVKGNIRSAGKSMAGGAANINKNIKVNVAETKSNLADLSRTRAINKADKLATKAENSTGPMKYAKSYRAKRAVAKANEKQDKFNRSQIKVNNIVNNKSGLVSKPKFRVNDIIKRSAGEGLTNMGRLALLRGGRVDRNTLAFGVSNMASHYMSGRKKSGGDK